MRALQAGDRRRQMAVAQCSDGASSSGNSKRSHVEVMSTPSTHVTPEGKKPTGKDPEVVHPRTLSFSEADGASASNRVYVGRWKS